MNRQKIFERRRRFITFTLIELLVVIAIIAILASMLLPMFGRARDIGRQTSCKNQMRNLYLVSVNYADDYKGYLPRYWYGAVFPGWSVSWVDILRNYYPNLKQINAMMHCPSYTEHYTRAGSLFHDSTVNSGYQVCYALPAATPTLCLGKITQPTNAAYMLEVASGYSFGMDDPGVCFKYPSSGWHYRHVGQRKMNIMFIDGHLEDLNRQIVNRNYGFGYRIHFDRVY